MAAPFALRPYARRYMEDTSPCRLVVKSRRIGMTYADACEASITAALPRGEGMDTWYSAQTAEDTREYVDYVRAWAHRLGIVSQMVDGSQFLHPDDANAEGVWAIRFASGHKVVTMTSNPRSIHGKQGRAVLDEAARYDRPNEFLEAALPLLMLGGRVSMISTESHSETLFHKYRQRLLEGDAELAKDWSLHECFFDAALRDGFYRWHVMPRLGLDPEREWTEDLEAAYRADVIRQMGEHADSQLFGVPKGANDVYLTRESVISCMHRGRPVLRFQPPKADEDGVAFVDWPEDRRHELIDNWLEANVKQHLDALDQTRPHALGHDYGRKADLTVLVPVCTLTDLTRSVPFVVELDNTPDDVQKRAYRYIIDALPRRGRMAFDAGGPGSSVAEAMRQRYGPQVAQLTIGTGKARPEDERKGLRRFYSELLPPLKAALECRSVEIPSDDYHVSDLMGLRLMDGMPRVPPVRTKDEAGTRHCDFAVALALGLWAAHQGAGDWSQYEAEAEDEKRRKVTQFDSPELLDEVEDLEGDADRWAL